jgi:hypothetical protein
MEKLGLQNITIKDVLISTLILFVTFGCYLDRYIPEGITEVNFLGITIGSYGFQYVSDMIYFVKMKLLIITFSLTWYFTSKHWWKSAILVIIIIELLKLFSALNSNQRYVDEIEYMRSLPLTIPVIILITFISKKVNDYNLANNLRIELDNKINKIFFELNEESISQVTDLKTSFIKIKNTEKINEDELMYLKKLIEMRDDFYKI